jgi:LmbE family N-acetylglucosaminyl deacetylase
MMRAVEAGRRVTCLTATKGEAGFPADDPRSDEERMAVRETELRACLSLLGVTEHEWLGYREGGCDVVPDSDIVPKLAGKIRELRPDTVLTFGPDGGTGHTDHVAVCRWSTIAVREAGVEDVRLLYAAKTPHWRDRFLTAMDPATVMMVEELEPEVTEEADLAVSFDCDPDLVARKITAMRAQESQIESLFQMLGYDVFADLVREEFFRAPRDTDPF